MRLCTLWRCGVPPETAEEASRRIERAGSTPPPTPTQDSDVISDEVTVHTAHEESSVLHEHDASYPLTIAKGQPPMERHLVPLSAQRYANCGAVTGAADSLSDAASVMGCIFV